MAKKLYKVLDLTSGILATVGALNWGFTALNWNLVEAVGDAVSLSWVATLVYALVGLSGLWIIGRNLLGKYMK